eukprot:TRINITY_DN1304_c0_g1_i1.p1 TRINITY_DN1304_c0_g1~~TRINITY_DN1304_c0_g1_i1.p1  ORF type:complete len:156 (+),score=22.96 TRINITY_DN1304_c0_g1_i1:291-758(+)
MSLGHITMYELANIQFSGVPLGLEVAGKLVKVFDKDHSGTIDFYEYATLHQFMNVMQNAFFSADRDRSGFLDYIEIHGALVAAGFQLSLPTVQAVVQKFDAYGRGIGFHQFLLLTAHLAHCRSIFEWNDMGRSGMIHLDYNSLCHIGTDLLIKHF